MDQAPDGVRRVIIWVIAMDRGEIAECACLLADVMAHRNGHIRLFRAHVWGSCR